MRALITGGAGFIGIQTADRLLNMGEEVVLLDNISRKGGTQNLAWLKERHGEYPFEEADVRDYASLTAIVERYQPLDVVFHFAAQVAVTSSVQDPKEDFDINALGTLNVLESIRQSKADPIFIYSSTNKVYGEMQEAEVVEDETRYRYAALPHGIPETAPLDFHSPYGCSKRAADQYTVSTSGYMGCERWCFEIPAYTDRANSESRIRVGWPGSSSPGFSSIR